MQANKIKKLSKEFRLENAVFFRPEFVFDHFHKRPFPPPSPLLPLRQFACKCRRYHQFEDDWVVNKASAAKKLVLAGRVRIVKNSSERF